MRTMTKNPTPTRDRVRVHSTPEGFAVQVYGQTVLRAVSHREALQKAAELRRMLN